MAHRTEFLTVPDWPRQASSLPSEASATLMTTPSPKRSTASTRPRSSIGADRGAASKRLNSPPWNGSTGSTIDDFWSPSATSRQPKPRSSTTPCWTNQPWLHNLNQTASGKPGAVHPVSSCFKGYGHLTRPLRSSPITGLSSLLRVGPPQSLASVLLPRSFGRFSVSLGIQDLVPAVPRESLRPIHALSAPVAIRPVIRCPADLSQRIEPPLVLATPTIFDVSSRVHLHSSLGYLPARINFGRFIQRSRPHLLDAAAWTGLRPTPESRSRGAHPHLSRSFTTCLSFISSLSACLCSTRSMAGLYAPLPTLRLHPRGCLRTNSGPMWLATPSS